MNKLMSRQILAVLALLCSSTGFAATVTVTPSNAAPTVGSTFTLTVSGAGFPDTVGATLKLFFDSTKVSVVAPAATSGIVLAPGSPFTGGISYNGTDPFASGNNFSVLAPTVGTLPTGNFDAFQLIFTALAVGPANIVLTDDQADFSWTDAVTFTAIPATYTQASVTVAPAAGPNIAVADSVAPTDDRQIPFGSVTQGQTGTQTVTVTNTGTTDLVLGTLASANPLAAPYSLSNDLCSGQTLAPATDCTVSVVFAPAATGPFNDTFDIPSNDTDEATVTVTLSGTGAAIPAPDITVTDSVAPASDNQIDFGNVTVGQTGTQTVTVTNSGNANLILGTVAAVDLLAAPYSLGTDNCSGQTLAPSSSCTVQVRFAPVAAGAASEAFDIPSNDADTPSVTMNLGGTGTPPVPNVVVTDSVAPASDLEVPFGSITQGQTGTQTVTVTNSGDANLVLGTVASANPLAAPFSVANDLCSGQSLAPASSCTFDVLFLPTAVGAANDGLDIPSNDPDTATVTVSVSGTGTPIPAPNIVVTDSVAPNSDLQVGFGSIAQNQTATQTVTVTNSGDASLVLGTVGSGNALAAPFSVTSDLCSGQTLAPTANCTFQVRFAPVAGGPFNDSLAIPSNDPDTATVTLDVTGTGATAVPNIVVTDSVTPADDLLVAFGTVRLNGTATPQTVTVTNSGDGNLVLGTVGSGNALAAPFSIANDTCSGQTLAPLASCTLQVGYQAIAIGVSNDAFDIPSNDPDTATVTVSVSGTGKKKGSSALDLWSLALLAGLPLVRRRKR